MNKQELKTFVSNCFPSIFTKDDVIKLIDMIEDQNDNLSDEKIDLLSSWIRNDISDNLGNSINYEADFEIECQNQIYISNLHIDYMDLKDSIVKSFKSFIENN